MKLQVALDVETLERARELIDQVKDYADIIELGTSFMGTYGYRLVETIRKEYPEIQILADVKIVDCLLYTSNAGRKRKLCGENCE